MRKCFNSGDLPRPRPHPRWLFSPWYRLLLLNSNRMKLPSLGKGVETSEASSEKQRSKTPHNTHRCFVNVGKSDLFSNLY